MCCFLELVLTSSLFAFHFASGGVVFFVQEDLKTGMSGESRVFSSPSLATFVGGGRRGSASGATGAVVTESNLAPPSTPAQTRSPSVGPSTPASFPSPLASPAATPSSPSFSPSAPRAPATRFPIGAIEVWSFVRPGSAEVETLSPRYDAKAAAKAKEDAAAEAALSPKM